MERPAKWSIAIKVCFPSSCRVRVVDSFLFGDDLARFEGSNDDGVFVSLKTLTLNRRRDVSAARRPLDLGRPLE